MTGCCAEAGAERNTTAAQNISRVSVERTSANRAVDLRADGGFAISVVIDRVAHIESAGREHDGATRVDSLRQPDAGERFTHHHAGFQLADAGEPREREKVEAGIIECEFDDLMLRGLDP